MKKAERKKQPPRCFLVGVDEVGCVALLPVMRSHGETMIRLLEMGGSVGDVASVTGKSRQWVHLCAKEMMDRLPAAISDRDDDEHDSGPISTFGELCGRGLARHELLA